MTINQNITLNEEKFGQALHYIISKVGTLDNVGKTVLFKMLYFSDFDFYELNELPITGEKYFKLPNGPAPASFDSTILKLETEKKVKKIDAEYKGFKQIKFISLCNPDLSLLNANELQLIGKVMSRLGGMTASQVSNYSHEDMPWKATEDTEEIDYELVFYRDPAFSVTEENALPC